MTDYEDHIPTWAELRDAHISKATMENSAGSTPEAVTGAEKEGIVTPGEEQQDMDCGTKDDFTAVGSDPVNKACTEGENGDEMLADDPAEEDPPAGPEKPAMKSGLTIAVEVSGGLHAAGCCEDTSPDTEEGKLVSDTHTAPEPQSTKGTKSKVTHPDAHPKPVAKSDDAIPTWEEIRKSIANKETAHYLNRLKEYPDDASSLNMMLLSNAANSQKKEMNRIQGQIGKDLGGAYSKGAEEVNKMISALSKLGLEPEMVTKLVNTAYPDMQFGSAEYTPPTPYPDPIMRAVSGNVKENESLRGGKRDEGLNTRRSAGRAGALYNYELDQSSEQPQPGAPDDGSDIKLDSDDDDEESTSVRRGENHIPTWKELRKAHITKRNTDIDRARLGVASHNDDDSASVNAINDLNTASENQFNNYEPSELEERTEVPFEAITGESEDFNNALEGGLERVNASKGVLNINDNPLRAEWRDGTLNNIMYDKQELAKLKELLDMCARQRSMGDIND